MEIIWRFNVSYYFNSYLSVLKRNFMLAIIGLILLIPTFFIWAGIPFFIVGSAVGDLTTNPILVYLSISLSGGLIISLYFLPINLKVAREMAIRKKVSTLNLFLRLESMWIIAVAIVYVIVLNTIAT